MTHPVAYLGDEIVEATIGFVAGCYSAAGFRRTKKGRIAHSVRMFTYLLAIITVAVFGLTRLSGTK